MRKKREDMIACAAFLRGGNSLYIYIENIPPYELLNKINSLLVCLKII